MERKDFSDVLASAVAETLNAPVKNVKNVLGDQLT